MDKKWGKFLLLFVWTLVFLTGNEFSVWLYETNRLAASSWYFDALIISWFAFGVASAEISRLIYPKKNKKAKKNK